MRARAYAALCTALLAGACAQATVVRHGAPVPYDKAAQDDLQLARGHMERQEFKEASEILGKLVEELPQSKRADEALFLLGQAQRSRGDEERAILAWRSLLERYPRSSYAPQASLGLAELYRDRDRPTIARRVLEDAPLERGDDPLRVRMYRLRADLARNAGDFPAAVIALAYARRDMTSADELYVLDLELDELIHDRLQDKELEAIVERLPAGPVRDEVLLEIASRAVARAEFGVANEALDRLPRRLRPNEEEQRARLRSRASAGVGSVVHSFGLAVPLSGPYAGFGESVLAGVTLALGILDDPPARYRLLIRDTKGEAEPGAAAVQTLADLNVRAIIGPMRSIEATRTAPIAEQARVPLLTLAPRAEIANLGEYVFRMGLTPDDQIEVLVQYAVERRGHRRFAILYPSADYGTNFKDLFSAAVYERGGEVVGVEAYDPDAVDHQVEIQKLVGLYDASPQQRKLIEERDRLRRRPQGQEQRLAELAAMNLPPHINFDALFIPDVARKVGLILPQLRLYDVRNVEFIGTSDWNDPKLIEIAGRDASGVVFTDAFYARSSDPAVREFVTRYRERYAREPDLFAAQGYDAGRLLRSLMDQGGQLSRDALQADLLRVRAFPGSSGLISIDDKGGAHRDLHLLTIEDGEIRELDETR